ncbi:MAG: hydroxyacid dehydrogenase [Microbacteriaceae bacterium]
MRKTAFAELFDSRRKDALTASVRFDGPPHAVSLDEMPPDRLASIEVLLTGWDAPRLTDDVLRRLPSLRAVLHCGGSIRGIVSDELWRRDIAVTSVPDVNAVPVAEFTFAFIVLAGKRAQVFAAESARARSDWSYVTQWGDLGNVGRTIGIVGFSQVGRRVVKLVQSLSSVTCLVADPYADADEVARSGARLVALDALLPMVDTLSLHAPATAETYRLIGAPELACLKDHATVINTARGSLIDTAALEAECVAGRLHAVLDVTDPEPLPDDSVLYGLPNVTLTPHVAGSMGSEMGALADAVLAQLAAYVRRESLPGRIFESDMEIIA